MLAEQSSPSPLSANARFIYAGNSRIGMREASGLLHYYLNDHLGSTRVVVDSTGLVKDFHHYSSFGGTLYEQTATNQAYRYTSKPLDKEGGLNLYYYGARYYDPELGRFLAIDPAAGNYPSLSPYAYCANNPLKNVDPDGGTILDRVVGVSVALLDNATGINLRDMYSPREAGDYNAGQTGGDLTSIAVGLAEMAIGGGGETGGTLLTAGSGGTLAGVGVPVIAVGAVVQAHGAINSLNGAINLAMQKGRIPGSESSSTRSEFNNKTRPAYWKEEASKNPSNYSKENLERMKQGKAPLDSEGKPMELHHKDPLSRGAQMIRTTFLK